jgi:hypothetical protein
MIDWSVALTTDKLLPGDEKSEGLPQSFDTAPGDRHQSIPHCGDRNLQICRTECRQSCAGFYGGHCQEGSLRNRAPNRESQI